MRFFSLFYSIVKIGDEKKFVKKKKDVNAHRFALSGNFYRERERERKKGKRRERERKQNLNQYILHTYS